MKKKFAMLALFTAMLFTFTSCDDVDDSDVLFDSDVMEDAKIPGNAQQNAGGQNNGNIQNNTQSNSQPDSYTQNDTQAGSSMQNDTQTGNNMQNDTQSSTQQGSSIGSFMNGSQDNNPGNAGSNNTGDIGEAEAKRIALSEVPGAADSDIRIYQEYDDGRLVYEGEIRYDGMEYEFEIDAADGRIIDWDRESIYD